jgi:ribosomal protein L11 methyltransferase
MKKQILEEKLFCCEFKSEISYAEFINELLAATDLHCCVQTNIDTNDTTYTAYSDSESEINKIESFLINKINEWKDYDVKCTNPTIFDIKKEDWTEVWKRYFKIQKITPNLVIKASWLEYDRVGDEKIIEIDPGMSFGTGSHETTQFCMKAIESLAKTDYSSLIDAGCGSGVLTIAAKMFGFKPIYAFDYDEDSIESSKDNFERNSVNLEEIDICAADIAEYEPHRTFDIVIANIISQILTKNSEKLLSWIRPGGCLVLAGILRTEYDKFRNLFITNDTVEIFSHTERDWTGGVFYKKLHKDDNRTFNIFNNFE